MKKRLKSLLILMVLCCIATILILLANGTVWIGEPSWKRYPVRGVDVSHYQGEIDWSQFAKQDITFAFLKATEGSKGKDEYFEENWSNIQSTQIRRGAYHFFSFDSKGLMQAENYISVVPKSENMLPPVVDVEFYGDKEKDKPDIDAVRKELDILLSRLEEYYGQRPIIYTTMKAYQQYIDGYYDMYPLWIRNVYYRPFLFKDRNWLFWQYTDRKILNGYDGDEKYIDMNIFNGDMEAFNDTYSVTGDN